jgi:hypothetical protein
MAQRRTALTAHAQIDTRYYQHAEEFNWIEYFIPVALSHSLRVSKEITGKVIRCNLIVKLSHYALPDIIGAKWSAVFQVGFPLWKVLTLNTTLYTLLHFYLFTYYLLLLITDVLVSLIITYLSLLLLLLLWSMLLLILTYFYFLLIFIYFVLLLCGCWGTKPKNCTFVCLQYDVIKAILILILILYWIRSPMFTLHTCRLPDPYRLLNDSIVIVNKCIIHQVLSICFKNDLHPLL